MGLEESKDQSCSNIVKYYQVVVLIVEWGKEGKMNQRVLWVETVLSYEDDDGLFLL